MSVVQTTTIGGGLIGLDKRINNRYFAIGKSNVSKKRLLIRREEITNLKANSAMTEAASAWNLLDQSTKDAWADAGAECGLTAYNTFLQDKMYRIKHSIAGNATPDVAHQYLVGHLSLPESGNHFVLRQVGNDLLEFPASLHLHYKSELIDETPPDGYLKVKFRYNYDEGGGEQTQENEVDLTLTQEWTSANTGITQHSGLTGYWELDIDGENVSGDFWFDDIYVLGASGILTKDPYCEAQNLKFNRIVFPAGISATSEYPV